MRYPLASWYPGPADKQGYPGLAVNEALGVTCHSMVGSADAALARLEGSDRASWCFSVTQSGKVLQHYDSLAVCWHAGTMLWNGRVIGIEHEGGPPGNESEPLTDAQRNASVALVRWLSQQHGFPMVRRVGLWEHNELYQTACPSGRIPWAAYLEAEEEDDVKPFLALEQGSPNTWLIGFARPILLGAAAEVAAAAAQYGAPDPRGYSKGTIDQMVMTK